MRRVVPGGTKAPVTNEPASLPEAAWRRVGAVIVTHHSGRVIGDCLRAIAAADQVVVVDNASDDDTLTLVLAEAPRATIVRNAVGLGYGNAANQGLARVDREFALLVNPDSLITPAAVAALVAAADRHPDAAVVGPVLLDGGGRFGPSHHLALFDRSASPLPGVEARPDGEICARYLSCAVALVRMSAAREVGGFDPDIFLYFEDDDFCLRLYRAGWSLLLAPDAEVVHTGGGSVRPSLGHTWEKYWHLAWSRLYCEAKWRGPAAGRRLALRHAGRWAGKGLTNLLVGNMSKAFNHAGRCAGALAFLAGLPATRSGAPALGPQERARAA